MIRWTISASALILLTLGLRKLTKKRLSLRLRYALWLPVLLRLLIPGSLWNLPALLSPTEAEPVSRKITRQEYPLHQTREYDPLFLEHDSQGYVILEVAEEAPTVEKASELEPAGEYTAPAVAVPTQAGETRDFKDLLPWIWAAGAGGVLAICLISELRFTLHLRHYTAGTSDALVLPLRQAAAIARSDPGTELTIVYVDSAGDRVEPCWVMD